MSKQFRICSTVNCKVRLPDVFYDGHTLCSGCIGKVCSLSDRCAECAGWSAETFESYVKHRHTLELNKLRKAKQRTKSKLVVSVIDRQVAGTAHSVSPSPSSSVVNLSTSSSVSAYSPSAATNPISFSPTANISAPRDQVVTRSEFDSLKALMANMASDLAALRKSDSSKLANVHSESVSPPSSCCVSVLGSRNL